MAGAPAVASAHPAERASCVGVGSANAKLFAGSRSDIAHGVIEGAPSLGLTPGGVYSSFARFHEGSLEGCLAVAPL